ncbi:hypothetical protein EPN90_02340 [Patescibacteria group bacterium]|nr:MAG: hypothetical protein EPN90_02340 [Patescibacteria group bacterium]
MQIRLPKTTEQKTDGTERRKKVETRTTKLRGDSWLFAVVVAVTILLLAAGALIWSCALDWSDPPHPLFERGAGV